MNAQKECRSAPCKNAAKKSIPHRHDILITESGKENQHLVPIERRKHTQSECTVQMNAFNRLTNRFTNRGKALSLYKRGMTKAKKHNHQGAIDDYTMTIDMPDTPPNVKAMVLYNRALVHVATGDFSKGDDDLETIEELRRT